MKEPHVLCVLCYQYSRYSLLFLYHFSTGSTLSRIFPFLRELNVVTLQRAKWGLKSSDSSDLMFTRSCRYSSSIFLQYSVAIIAMKLSQHTYPGTLITDPTAVCGSVVPHMRVLWPAFTNLEHSGYSLTAVGELLPAQATWADVSASFSGLSSDSILLFRPYLGILSSLTF